MDETRPRTPALGVNPGETGRTRSNTLQPEGVCPMKKATIRSRSGGRSWYQGEKSCPAELEFAIRELRARCRRLERDPANEELHNSCSAKVVHLKHLTNSLELDDEIREAAHRVLAETEQRLDAMPVGRRNRLISSSYSDAW
jgi:hypothetical protein